MARLEAGVIALLRAVLGASASAAQQAARVVERAQMVWSRTPGFADVAAAYPPGGAGATGLVLFRCQVAHDGALTRCDVAGEAPVGRGFAAAARSLLPGFGAELSPGRTEWPVELKIRMPPPEAPESRDRIVQAPVWLAGPDQRTILALYPAAARARGIATGLGTVRCGAGPQGWLVDCVPVSADPDGLGFAEAALKVAPLMQMSLWTAAGGPTDGPIILPIRFSSHRRWGPSAPRRRRP